MKHLVKTLGLLAIVAILTSCECVDCPKSENTNKINGSIKVKERTSLGGGVNAMILEIKDKDFVLVYLSDGTGVSVDIEPIEETKIVVQQ